MVAHVPPILRHRARTMRTEQADPEALLWSRLRAKRLNNMKFRRQVPMGRHVVDFFCPAIDLVMELDGAQHLEDAAIHYDARRTAWLEAQSYTVLRVPDNEVMEALDEVCHHIAMPGENR